MVPYLKSLRLTFALSYKYNNIIFEVSYLKGLSTINGRKELENTLYLKPFDLAQFSIAYHFKTKLLRSEKGLDCPSF